MIPKRYVPLSVSNMGQCPFARFRALMYRSQLTEHYKITELQLSYKPLIILFLFHTRLLHNLITILSFQVWVNAPLNLEAFSDYLSSDTYYTICSYNLEEVVVTMSWYLVKIVETHLEIIKDEVIVVLVNFQGYLSFSSIWLSF